jgi:hypothetical protein
MSVMLLRGFLAALLTSSFAVAQEPTGPQDATIQALLKEVHALRIALERGNQIGPKIQIALARMQLQEEQVRDATHQVQDIRERIGDIQNRRAEGTDRVKKSETQQAQAVDPNARKQMDLDISGMKDELEHLGALEH